MSAENRIPATRSTGTGKRPTAKENKATAPVKTKSMPASNGKEKTARRSVTIAYFALPKRAS